MVEKTFPVKNGQYKNTLKKLKNLLNEHTEGRNITCNKFIQIK